MGCTFDNSDKGSKRKEPRAALCESKLSQAPNPFPIRDIAKAETMPLMAPYAGSALKNTLERQQKQLLTARIN